MSSVSRRRPSIHHCTSHPLRFFGREAEMTLLDEALDSGAASLVALVGPGGQGKTAIVQEWLERAGQRILRLDGVFFWSFYRGKSSDLCLRQLFAYAEGLPEPPEVSASYCVDRLVPRLQRERWAVVLDGTEVVQHETGQWFGRFLHPELGRLLEELAAMPLPGLAVLTTRFPLPTLEQRRHARILPLSTLDMASGRGLLASLGVHGTDAELEEAARSCGLHAKAVELLGTYLVRFHGGAVQPQRGLPAALEEGASAEELHVARVLAALQEALPQEEKDVLGLATAFRQPPTEARLLEYLVSEPVRQLLHDGWGRGYPPFGERDTGRVRRLIQGLVDLRLLERVGLTLAGTSGENVVIDAHPLVRRGFDNVLGTEARRHGATARAGFLRGRPDRRSPQALVEAREEIELFHAYCDAGLWNEADSTFVALDNPKHRFLAPAFERDLLLRFFPEGDRRRPPLWAGFGRYRSLAICLELLGQFEEALGVYRAADAPLRGDALIALGNLQPLVDQPHVAHPWQTLWQAYRAHALCLRGRTDEALTLAQGTVALDVYEWVHVFECLLRLGRLELLDLGSLLYRQPFATEHRWAALAGRRMRADYLRLTGQASDLGTEYRSILEAYDRGGLPYERSLTRLSYGRWLMGQGRGDKAGALARGALELARRHGMAVVEIDALELMGEKAQERRKALGYEGPGRV
jgi:tetratricopeptide (TPR) repeat protein